MSHTASNRPAARPPETSARSGPNPVVAVAVAVMTVAAVVVSISVVAASIGQGPQQPNTSAPLAIDQPVRTEPPLAANPTSELRGVVTEADGVLPDGTTPFDSFPGVNHLDQRLLQAVRDAAGRAARDGIEFEVNSGWRSAAYQNLLLDEAVVEYGSEAEAAKWVAPADTSAHVSGHAVDVGPVEANEWLSRHGDAYGLCQIYMNEIWHYELRPDAIDHGCPPMYTDPTDDPRFQP